VWCRYDCPLGAHAQFKPWLQHATVNMLDLIPDDTPKL
jgi:hypothetical protein